MLHGTGPEGPQQEVCGQTSSPGRTSEPRKNKAEEEDADVRIYVNLDILAEVHTQGYSNYRSFKTRRWGCSLSETCAYVIKLLDGSESEGPQLEATAEARTYDLPSFGESPKKVR